MAHFIGAYKDQRKRMHMRNQGKKYSGWTGRMLQAAGLAVVIQFAVQEAFAACATVKIEISQEVTLERQAFDAHMRIKNDLDGISLESVDVDVVFTDGDGNTVRGAKMS